MAQPKQSRRLDIQGLRAVASLLVASFHIWFGGVSGGVDVFFAIGGYLLAGSLARQLEHTGRVDVPGTLWRTVQRLFPMAAIVLLVAGAIALIASGPLGMSRVAADIFAAAGYWENWRLAADATDYVAAGHDKSAFQHFWAMGAQGQFTAGCIVAAGVFAAVRARRGRPGSRTGLGIMLAAVAVASFVYALVRLGADPVPAYYDTFARSWELAAGGAAALLLARIPLHRAAKLTMGIVGIVMVLTAGLLPREWLEPGWVTLYPVAGALLILLAGEGEQQAPVSRMLRWRPLVWLGGISYGIYLWHWPVLKGFIGAFPDQGQVIDAWEGLGILAVSILLAHGSYRLIDVVHLQPTSAGPRWLVHAMPLIAVASLVGVAVAPAVQRDAIQAAADRAPVAHDGEELADWIADAVARPAAPAPGALVGGDARSSEWIVDHCLTVGVDSQQRCRFDDSASDDEVWIVGDSQAVTWAPAVRRALDGAADLQLLGRPMCPFSSGEAVERQIGSYKTTCEAHAEDVLALAETRRPSLVIITYGAWWVGEGYEDRPADTAEQLAAGTLEYAGQLEALGARTVWLDSPPPADDPAACLQAHTAGQRVDDVCTAELQPAQLQRHRVLGSALEAGGVEVIDSIGWFCDIDAMACPLVVEGVPTWVDATHMGVAAAAQRSSVLAESLGQLLTVEPPPDPGTA